MKKFLLAAAAAALLTAPAAAADLGARTRGPVYKAPVAAPAFSWTGFYIGLNGGYGWGKDDRDINGATQGIKPDGGLVGGQIGYNWQVDSNWVFGVELSGDWASLKQTDSSTALAGGSQRSEINGLMMAAGRIGYAVGSWLPYVKGGYAGGNVKGEGSGVGYDVSNSNWQSGWVIGAGFEYAVAPNWVMGLEYDHIDLGNSTWNTSVSGTPVSISDDVTADAVVGRVSYKFGGR